MSKNVSRLIDGKNVEEGYLKLEKKTTNSNFLPINTKKRIKRYCLVYTPKGSRQEIIFPALNKVKTYRNIIEASYGNPFKENHELKIETEDSHLITEIKRIKYDLERETKILKKHYKKQSKKVL